MPKQYNVSDEQKKSFAGVYLLEYMINMPKAIHIFLDGNDQDLEPVLEWLMARQYIEIKDNEKYIPTAKGRDELKRFMVRYSDYLTMFDIYSAVDLESGEFAFARYFDFKDDTSWKKYLDEQRWEDLRIAVAEYKEMDPVEIVFMGFINERRFGRDASGWQFDLLLGSVWDAILDICNMAIRQDDLAYEDEQGRVTGSQVLQDVTTQGTEIMLALLKTEKGRNQERYCFGSFHGDEQADAEYYVDKVTVPTQPTG